MKERNNGSKVPGPGEILSELHLGLDIQLLEGKITPAQAQETFSRVQYELSVLHVDFPELPFEEDSTQVRSLEEKKKELRKLPRTA